MKKARRDSPHLAGKILVWSLGGFLVFGMIALAWVGIRGALAIGHLNDVHTSAPEVVSSFAREPSEGTEELRALAAHTRTARDLTSDPIWKLVERAPWIGPQLKAVSVVTASSDELVRLSVFPLVEATQASAFDALKPVDGRIDTSALTAIEAPAADAAVRAEKAAADIRAIDRTPLVGRLADVTDTVEEVFSQASGGLDALSRASQLLPDMLGGSGQRSYLVLVQNNAELRSLGGIAGTALLLQTDGGRMIFAGTTSGAALSRNITAPAVSLPAEVESIYGTRPARYFQNVTQIPDFTIDGPLAREMYRQQTGREVDGVVAIDPVVLSYLLEATGPVSLPEGTNLDADNAVSLFLSDVYQRYPDPVEQDAFFAASSAAIFDALLNGDGSSADLLSALARAIDERRVLMWSARAEEQIVIEGSPMAGQLPSTDAHTTRFGVFFNDGGGSKMSYYVKPDVSVSWSRCALPQQSVPRQLTLTAQLTNVAPVDASTSLPRYVTGGGVFGVAPGTAAIVGDIYLPEGTTLVSAQATNGVSFSQAELQGRSVLSYGVNLAPQSAETISVVVETTSSARSAEALVTPTADSSINPVVTSTCDVRSGATLQ